MKLLLLTLVLALVGCATFVKAGATQADWQRDKTDCLVKANQAGYSAENWSRGQFIRECLGGQGWTQQ